MSKDTINPTQNNNMEYTYKETKAKDLKVGDDILTRQDGFQIIKSIKNTNGNFEVELNNGQSLHITHSDDSPPIHPLIICRVPSSPVMSEPLGFEEFIKKYFPSAPLTERFIGTYGLELRNKYEGYLIGTRSIVPEMTDEEINVMALEDDGNTKFSERLFYSHGAKAYRNWLRFQINK